MKSFGLVGVASRVLFPAANLFSLRGFDIFIFFSPFSSYLPGGYVRVSWYEERTPAVLHPRGFKPTTINREGEPCTQYSAQRQQLLRWRRFVEIHLRKLCVMPNTSIEGATGGFRTA